MDKKWMALFLLVLQTSSHSLAIRYSRTSSPGYSITNVVFISEILKAIMSLFILLLNGEVVQIFILPFKDPLDSLKMLVPAACYFLQNNLTFIALSNLDAATYQILYQMKILTTALFCRFMLKKILNIYQWIALMFLFAGVCVVQLGIDSRSQSSKKLGDSFTGLMCVVTAAISSGFSAIYFEKVIKSSSKSLWIRNLELAFFSVIFGSFTIFDSLHDPSKLVQSFDFVVYLVLFLQSFGGLLVGYIVKYADNLMKVFACAVAFVISTAISIIFFELELTNSFIFGSSMILLSIALYSYVSTPLIDSTKIKKN